jgi:hypothetical protein
MTEFKTQLSYDGESVQATSAGDTKDTLTGMAYACIVHARLVLIAGRETLMETRSDLPGEVYAKSRELLHLQLSSVCTCLESCGYKPADAGVMHEFIGSDTTWLERSGWIEPVSWAAALLASEREVNGQSWAGRDQQAKEMVLAICRSILSEFAE